MTEWARRIAEIGSEKHALLAHKLRYGQDVLAMIQSEPIAVIGIGCRFPGGIQSPEDYWSVLKNGVDAICEVPPDRWDVDEIYDPDPIAVGKSNARWGGFLQGIDGFDSQFFSISPNEAAWIDPQQRLVLEVACSALDDAGVVRETLSGTQTGVFLGVTANDYSSQDTISIESLDAYAVTGVARSLIANRLSYFLDLKGPSLVLDTACSSSGVAIHLACQSLLAGESNLVITGGVNVLLDVKNTIALSRWGTQAPDGRCKAFDSRADGMVRAEGCGLVVLKRLSDAMADGDRVIAMIRGSASNQDGRSSGITAPNAISQEANVRLALGRAGLEGHQVGFVEAHGTGTSIGDPIEMEALKAVYGAPRTAEQAAAAVDTDVEWRAARDESCYVGSTKANIGHLEGASGAAGLIKAILVLHNELIPGQLHFKKLNPAIDLQGTAMAVSGEPVPWPRGDVPRFAGVSSFGFGGTNAHIVLQDAPPSLLPETREQAANQPQIVLLSAHLEESLRGNAERLIEHLDQASDAALQDIAATSSLHRTHLERRLGVVGSTTKEMSEALAAFLEGEARPNLVVGSRLPGRRSRPVAFIFQGQGSQWFGMCRQLLESEPVFAEAIETCDRAMRPHVSWSLVDLLADRLDQTSTVGDDRLTYEEAFERLDVLQPLLFGVQVGLAALWRSWGVIPDAVIGHSMGEIAAAHVAGALSLEDAALISCRRGELLRRMRGTGAMAMLGLTIEEAKERLEPYGDEIGVAVSNSRISTVVSGKPEAVRDLVASLEKDEVFCRMIKGADVPSHCPMMQPICEDLRTALQKIAPQDSSVPFYSTVTGGVVPGGSLDPDYWVENLRGSVLFADGVKSLLTDSISAFLEIGPHPILLPAVEQNVMEVGDSTYAGLASMRREEDELVSMRTALAGLHCNGVAVDWRPLMMPARSCVPMPPYAWHHQRHWVTDLHPPSRRSQRSAKAAADCHPFLGARLDLAGQEDPIIWECELDLVDVPFLNDHRVRELVLMPAAGFAEMALAAANQVFGSVPAQLEEIELETAMLFPDDGYLKVQLRLARDTEPDLWTFQVFSCAPSEGSGMTPWSLHAWGRVRRLEGTVDELAIRADDEMESIDSIRQRCTEPIPGGKIYEILKGSGIQLGLDFQTVGDVWASGSESLGRLAPVSREMERNAHRYLIHPLLVDACIQVMGASMAEEEAAQEAQSGRATFMPIGIGKVVLLRDPAEGRWIHGSLGQSEDGSGAYCGSATMLDEQGQVVLIMRDIRSRRIERLQPLQLEQALYGIRWEQAEPPAAPSEDPADDATGGGRWLILADCKSTNGAESVGRRVAAELEQRGRTCMIVEPGDGFKQAESGEIEVDLSDPEHMWRCVEAWSSAGSDEPQDGDAPPLEGVVHLWSLDATAADAEPGETSQQSMAGPTCLSVLHLVQALARLGSQSQPRLWLVSRSASAVEEGEAPSLEQSLVCGLGRVIGREHPELSCVRVDLGGEDNEIEVAALVEDLLGGTRKVEDELETEVALRGDKRFVARLKRSMAPLIPATAPSPGAPGHRALRADATYVIVGGMGGLGLAISDWMADQGVTSIALISRSKPGAEIEEQLDAIRQKGATVKTYSADVSCYEQIAGALEQVRRDQPSIRGIIHSAVVLDDGVLLHLTRERVEKVLGPKVAGGWNLHRATRDDQLDHFILFSSAASMLGSSGQASYVAANAFLDSLAELRRAQGQPGLSICWGPWSEVGGAAGQDGVGAWVAKVGIEPITAGQGVEIFGRLLEYPRPRVGVMPFELETWFDLNPELERSPLYLYLRAEHAAAGAAESGRRSISLTREGVLQAAPEERSGLVEDYLRQWVARIMGASPSAIEIEQPLTKYGIDSLVVIKLRNQLEADLGVTLPVAKLFQGVSIVQLVEWMVAEIVGEPQAAAPVEDKAADGKARSEARRKAKGASKSKKARRGRARRQREAENV